jgi:hypothetical protein
MRAALFEAHLVGHPATRRTILKDCPEASQGCPTEDADSCLIDPGARQRALVWAIRDGHPAIVGVLIDFGARVDVPAHGITPCELALQSSSWRVREIVEEARNEIRLAKIISR